MEFTFEKTPLPGVLLVRPEARPDHRGWLSETYRFSAFAPHGAPGCFRQENLSFSRRNVLRGLHYQSRPHAQSKLVSCLSGAVYDVAVDIREGAPTFGKWFAAELNAENRLMIYLPPGFAHGFQVLGENALVSYRCDREYVAGAERGIIWNDPCLGIEWPCRQPVLSDRDRRHPPLAAAEKQ